MKTPLFGAPGVRKFLNARITCAILFGMGSTDKHYPAFDQVGEWRAEADKAGRSVAVVAGTFDLLQPGNLSALLRGKQEADLLGVILEPDVVVDRHVDPDRPRRPLHERTEFVANLRHVDAITTASPENIHELLSLLQPFTWVFCPGQSDDPFREAGLDMAEHEAAVPSLPGCSTDNVVNAIRTGGTPIHVPNSFRSPIVPPPGITAPGGVTVTVNGCFDLLHIAHLRFLSSARGMGDNLTVLINDDESVRRYKGDDRPVFPSPFRSAALASLESVSEVRVFSEDNPLAELRKVRSDIHCKGGSFEPGRAEQERELVESWGGRLEFMPLEDGYSSSAYIDCARTK